LLGVPKFRCLEYKSLPSCLLQVLEVAAVVCQDLQTGLVQGPDLSELGHMVIELALGVLPSMLEGYRQEVHATGNLPRSVRKGNCVPA
jgi:hypothetical protein